MNQPIAIPTSEIDAWKAWLATRKVGSMTIVAAYKRYLAHFYWLLDKPIAAVSEDDMTAYAEAVRGHEEWSERTQHNRLQAVRSYWTFHHPTERKVGA